MSGGIDSQYGFLFQKYVYILMLLKHMSMDACFTYEGIDDIDIEKEEPLHSIIISQKSFIQVKSGNINQKCMIKVYRIRYFKSVIRQCYNMFSVFFF